MNALAETFVDYRENNSLYTTAEIEKVSAESFGGAIILSNWLNRHGKDLVIGSVGVPSILSGPDSVLVISGQDVNALDYVSRNKGTTHGIGEVITYQVSGGTSGSQYDVGFPFGTTNGQAILVIQKFLVW